MPLLLRGIRAMNVSVGDDNFMPGTLLLPPHLHSIPRSCFKDCCKSLTHIRIPPSVVESEAYAFLMDRDYGPLRSPRMFVGLV